MEPKAIIEIRSISKTYKGADAPAVDNLSLSIAENEIFGLLGPNGAGKTTTISMLCGLYRPTAGSISIGGYALRTQLDEVREIIGVVPQDIALYPSLTGRENLLFFGRMYGLRGVALKQRVNECLRLFELEYKADKRVHTYSGGMKRRINLIAGILHHPKVLFLDEPTVGIDVQSRNVITGHLRNINKEGTTIVYTSHHMEEAESLCTRIAIIDQGKLIIDGAPKALIESRAEYTNLESIFLHLTGRTLRD